MAARFVYGLLKGQRVHVRDLNPAVHRGRACGCQCSECGRWLQAHMGEVQPWHFQHDAADVSCNPQPMTLLHAFVRDRLASKRRLWLPGANDEVIVEFDGQRWADRAISADQVYEFTDGRTEASVGSRICDVVLSVSGSWDLVIEVRKSHLVDVEKQRCLRFAFVEAIEFDVSDMPAAGITSVALEVALLERWRWKWLASICHSRAEQRLRDKVAWEQTVWRPDIEQLRSAQPYRPPASAKLRQAQKRLPWAKVQLARIKATVGSRLERAALLGPMAPEDRVAVVCAALGIEASNLPINFVQTVRHPLERHAYAWQLPLFAHFGVGRTPFTSLDALIWLDAALPDCSRAHPHEVSRNGFNRTRAAIHSYLLQLEAQQLLSSDRNRAHEVRVFQPVFPDRSAFLARFAPAAE